MTAFLTLVLDGEVYRCPRLSAFRQHDLLGAVDPFLDALRGASSVPEAQRLASLAAALLAAAEGMTDAETEALIVTCLADVERQDDETWVPVYDAEAGEIGDTRDGIDLIRLAVAVVWLHLGPLLTREQLAFEPSEPPPPGYGPITLPRNRGWLLAPVEHQMVRYESLLDGTVDLSDIALMNEALAVRAENTHRLRRAAEDEAQWRAQNR